MFVIVQLLISISYKNIKYKDNNNIYNILLLLLLLFCYKYTKHIK